jgi:DNA-binding response OmpR family regulator
VDDEPRILRYLEHSLEEAGYRAIVTSKPTDVTRLVELEEPDLVLLDLMLPGTSSFELLQCIREFSGVPVIFVTARDQDEDTVQALKMGADDYITKPFSPSELLARIAAALRRRVLADQMEVRPPFMLNELVINFAERRVAVEGQPVCLSATEYKILYELASHAGMVLPTTRYYSGYGGRNIQERRNWCVPSSATCGASWAMTPGAPTTSLPSLRWATGCPGPDPSNFLFTHRLSCLFHIALSGLHGLYMSGI